VGETLTVLEKKCIKMGGFRHEKEGDDKKKKAECKVTQGKRALAKRKTGVLEKNPLKKSDGGQEKFSGKNLEKG